MAKVRNHFKQLLAQVETETGHRPTYSEIQEETGIAASTLSAYAQDTVSRYDGKTLVELVKYFDKRLQGGCTLADLLEYPPDQGQELSYSTELAPATATP